jgi:hypothetical protein
MENTSKGSISLDVMDSYKVAVPSSLSADSIDTSITFCSHCSCPITSSGLSKDTCDELLSFWLEQVLVNFRACADPEFYLGRVDHAQKNSAVSEAHEQTVVLVGASNFKYSAKHFACDGKKIVDVSCPGWTANTDNISKLANTVSDHISSGAVGFVFDLFGNTSVRYEQFDGSTSLPFLSQGKYHLGGKIIVSPPDIFKKTVECVWPILAAKKDINCVIIPPMPRYLFARCCNDPGHCTNADGNDFSQSLLASFQQLRHCLIRLLVARGLTNFKVLDTCCTTTCTNTAPVTHRLAQLKQVTAKDGVHFIAQGYANMANRASATLQTLFASAPRTRKENTHFWRGFRSPVGARTGTLPQHQRGAQSISSGNSISSRGGPRRGYHLYRRN